MKNKTSTISVRLTHDELKAIEEKAESAGMNRNKYIVTSLLNRQDGVDPALLCRLRHIQAILCGYNGELTEDMQDSLKGDIDTVCSMLLR